MIELLNNVLLNARPGTVLVICTTVILIVLLLPKALRKSGIKKIAGMELHSQEEDYARQYEINKEVIEIDTRLKESLWEYTEDLLMDFADRSTLTCDAAIGHVLGGIFNHMRAHIMLNHLTTKLAVSNEDKFIKKLTRNVRVSLSDAKRSVYEGCPCKQEMQELEVSRYNNVIMKWIKDARIMVVASCEEKIELYERAIKDSKSDYWKDVFRKCIEKNEMYIEDMTSRRSHGRRHDECED